MAEGTQVGAYRVLRQIGEGGKGSVWLAEHLALERRAALKMRPPECSNRAAIVTQSFEARVTTAIADPGVAGEIGDTVPSGLQRRHPGPGCAPLIRCSRA